MSNAQVWSRHLAAAAASYVNASQPKSLPESRDKIKVLPFNFHMRDLGRQRGVGVGWAPASRPEAAQKPETSSGAVGMDAKTTCCWICGASVSVNPFDCTPTSQPVGQLRWFPLERPELALCPAVERPPIDFCPGGRLLG